MSEEDKVKVLSAQKPTLQDIRKMLAEETKKLREEGKGLHALKIVETPYKWQLDALEAWKRGAPVQNTEGKRYTEEDEKEGRGKKDELLIEYPAPKRGIIVAPTASGKTMVAFLAMREEGDKTLVIVPTEAIMMRWLEDLEQREASVGLFYGKEKSRGADVDIAIINSVNFHHSRLDNYQMVIFDEVHHLGSEEFIKMVPLLKGKKIMGLTSTIKRTDGREKLVLEGVDISKMSELDIRRASNTVTGDWYVNQFKNEKDAIPVVFKYTMKQAMEDEVVANVDTYLVATQLHCSCGGGEGGRGAFVLKHTLGCEYGDYQFYTEQIRKLWAILHPRDLAHAASMGWMGRQLVGYISKRKTLVSQGFNKPSAVLQVIQKVNNEAQPVMIVEGKVTGVMLRKKEMPKMILFSESIKGIERMQKYIEQVGGIKTGLYHSKLDGKERQFMFERWRRGEFQILLSVRALDEGINVPEVKVGIVVASGRANRQWVQRIGRILRKTGENAQLYLVYLGDTYEKEFPTQLKRVLMGHY